MYIENRCKYNILTVFGSNVVCFVLFVLFYLFKCCLFCSVCFVLFCLFCFVLFVLFVLFCFVLFVLYRCSELKVEVDRFRVVVEENERVVNDLRR